MTSKITLRQFLLAAMIVGAGCGGEHDPDGIPAETTGDTTSATSRDDAGQTDEATATAVDYSDGYFEGDGFLMSDTHANVIRQITFIGEDIDGIAVGFDLDNKVSQSGDIETCLHGDLVSPEGVEGIDNQFATIWPALKPLVGEQIEGLLQGAINEGRILIIVELVGLDDLKNDDDVTVNVFRARLDPEIGTRGLISPDQTFYKDYDHPISSAKNVQLVDGELFAGPVALEIPIDILDAQFNLTIPEAWFRLTLSDDGAFSGYFGGAFDVPSAINELLNTGARAETELVAPVFEANTDMGMVDGTCTLMSAAFFAEGTTAFVVRDANKEPSSNE